MSAASSAQPVRRSERISHLQQHPPPAAPAPPAPKPRKTTARPKNIASAADVKPKLKPATKRAPAAKKSAAKAKAPAKKVAVKKAAPAPQAGASTSASKAFSESKLRSILGIMLAKGCCPICLNTLERPRALVECGHVFCHACLEAKWTSPASPASDRSSPGPAPYFIATLGDHRYKLTGFTEKEESHIVDGVFNVAMAWAAAKSKAPPHEQLMKLVGTVAESNKRARVTTIDTAGATLMELPRVRELEDSPRTGDVDSESDRSPPACPKCSVKITSSPIRISSLSAMAPHLAELDNLLTSPDEEARSPPPSPEASDVDEDWSAFGLIPIRSKRAHSEVDSDSEDTHEEELRKARRGKAPEARK